MDDGQRGQADGATRTPPFIAWRRTGPLHRVAPTNISSTGSKAAGLPATSTECSSMPAGVLALDIQHWFLIRTAQISRLRSSSRSIYRLTGNVWTPSRALVTGAS